MPVSSLRAAPLNARAPKEPGGILGSTVQRCALQEKRKQGGCSRHYGVAQVAPDKVSKDQGPETNLFWLSATQKVSI